MHFTGRFTLQSLNAARAATENPATKKTEMRPSVTVVLSAIYTGTPTDEAYHRATPFGKIELNITNPDVAEPLYKLWHAYITAPEPERDGTTYVPGPATPRFEVSFRLMDPSED